MIIRAALESAAAPRACQLVRTEDLDELQLLLIKQRRLALEGASESFMELDEQFHRRLALVAHMPTLSQFLDQLGAFVQLTRIGAATPSSHMTGLVGEHEHILSLLETRNAGSWRRCWTSTSAPSPIVTNQRRTPRRDRAHRRAVHVRL